jgi:ABC-type transporter Mla subunit MlaD
MAQSQRKKAVRTGARWWVIRSMYQSLYAQGEEIMASLDNLNASVDRLNTEIDTLSDKISGAVAESISQEDIDAVAKRVDDATDAIRNLTPHPDQTLPGDLPQS